MRDSRSRDTAGHQLDARRPRGGIRFKAMLPQDTTGVLLDLLGNGFYATVKQQRDGAQAGFRSTLRVAARDLGDTSRSASATRRQERQYE
jgi:hypothetical protein